MLHCFFFEMTEIGLWSVAPHALTGVVQENLGGGWQFTTTTRQKKKRNPHSACGSNGAPTRVPLGGPRNGERPENSKSAHLSVRALQTPPKFNEKTSQREERKKFPAGERKKRAKFWAVQEKGGPRRGVRGRGPKILNTPTTHTHKNNNNNNNQAPTSTNWKQQPGTTTTTTTENLAKCGLAKCGHDQNLNDLPKCQEQRQGQKCQGGRKGVGRDPPSPPKKMSV